MKIIKLIGSLFLFVLLFHSCDLDREPNDYIGYERAYRNLQDAKKWDNGVYSTLRGKFGGGYVLPQEAQADMLNAHAAYKGAYAAFHSWNIKAEDETIKAIYHSYYAALVDVNVIIEKAPKLDVAKRDEATRDRYLGNAYFARAFYYFNLALRWGMPYNKSTASTDLCVPLELQALSLTKKSRATNKEVYDLIIEDLNLAEAKLETVPCEEGASEITKDAAKALKARVYLYMGDFENAYRIATQIISEARYPLIAPLASGEKDSNGVDNPFIQMWHYDNGKEQIWQPEVDRPNEVPTTTNLYAADMPTWQYWKDRGVSKDYNKPSYLPTGTVIYNWVADKDRRTPAYFEYVNTTVNDVKIQAQLFVISKFKGNPKYSEHDSEQWGGYVPNSICSPKPFRIAEQYLIAAESAFEVGKSDDASKYLNTLRASRGLPAIVVKDNALRDAIRKERAVELAYEGFRLWDLRRWNLPIDGRLRQGTQKAYPISPYFFSTDFKFDMKVEANNHQFIWGFPKDEVVEINKNIKQNAGW